MYPVEGGHWTVTILLLVGVLCAREIVGEKVLDDFYIDDNAIGRTLNLTGKGIEELRKQTFYFRNLTEVLGLRNLLLAGNSIGRVPDDCFGTLVRLTSVDLSRNRLTRIPADIFANNPLLSTVYLQSNHLSEVHFDFGRLVSLRLLNVTSNSLAWLNESSFSGFITRGPVERETRSLYAGDNPFECGCEMAWLGAAVVRVAIDAHSARYACTENNTLHGEPISCLFGDSTCASEYRIYMDICLPG